MNLPKTGVRKLNIEGETYFYIVKHEFLGESWIVSIGKVSNPDVRIHLEIAENDPELSYSSENFGPGGKVTEEIIERAVLYTNKHSTWQHCKEWVNLTLKEGEFSLYMKD